jgi:hypothetical protein
VTSAALFPIMELLTTKDRRSTMSSFWTKRKFAWFFVAGVTFGVLWWTTDRWGVPFTRTVAAAKYVPVLPDGRVLERSSCEASSVGPLLVRASYAWVGGPLLGAAATVHYLWLGWWTVEIGHSSVRVL